MCAYLVQYFARMDTYILHAVVACYAITDWGSFSS